jgi:putative ABC transport system permease protein
MQTITDALLKHSDVRKVFGLGYATFLVDDIRIVSYVTEDASMFEGSILLRGRYPKHRNEIAIAAVVSRVAGKGVGDTVAVRFGDRKMDYIITGIVQYMNNGGFNGLITDEALQQIQPDYIITEFAVYLNEGVDINAFIEEMWATHGSLIDTVLNTSEQVSAQLGSMGDVFGAVAVGIVAITALVVILTLYMVIKTAILRQRRELGIQKAVGFTTLQLMNQIALNMTPVILIGVILGAVAGYFGFNPMMIALMTGMGVVQVDLPVPFGQMIVVCIALVVLAYVVSMLIAVRIRKISAYALVSE